MGNSSDTYKSEVKNNIDTIRIKLNDVIKTYQQNDHKQAFSKAQSAYLDSYENIEIPLRPINPDFVLDMEIKFAELRNLLSSNSPLPSVIEKISEIQKGLDESERLVSGPGIVATNNCLFIIFFNCFQREIRIDFDNRSNPDLFGSIQKREI